MTKVLEAWRIKHILEQLDKIVEETAQRMPSSGMVRCHVGNIRRVLLEAVLHDVVVEQVSAIEGEPE